jgi:hypothetical protein
MDAGYHDVVGVPQLSFIEEVFEKNAEFVEEILRKNVAKTQQKTAQL